jgi:hypothetical protein
LRPHLKQARKVDKLRQQIAADLGIELEPDNGEDVPGDLEAEAILAYMLKKNYEVSVTGTIKVDGERVKYNKSDNTVTLIRHPLLLNSLDGFVYKLCPSCDQEFAVGTFATSSTGPYAPVAYCSTPCRVAALAKIGIRWDPHKSAAERWGRIPMVVPPEVVEIVRYKADGTGELSGDALSEISDPGP